MPGLEAVGLEAFLAPVLAKVAKDQGIKGPLTPGRISLAGHSAGGHQGVDASLGEEPSKYEEKITDITLMDSSYSDDHFADASRWIFRGLPNKSLRIIGSQAQITVSDEAKAHHQKYFSLAALKATAAGRKGEGFSVVDHPPGNDVRDKSKVMNHFQVMKDGAVQADILILQSTRPGNPHHEIRDDVMEDAMFSIGQGAKGSAGFDAKKP